MSSIEVKIRKLDGELSRYKEQMNKLRNGPGKVPYTTICGGIVYNTHQKKLISFLIKEAIQQRALRTLKQKRMYESQLTQLSQQTFNMESAALATENLRNTMATVDAMQMANKEIRKQYGKLDIDQIEVSEKGGPSSFMTFALRRLLFLNIFILIFFFAFVDGE